MNVELLITLRYFFTRQHERFIAVISLMAIMGIAIGVAALIGTLGVMTGFGNQLREKIIGASAHVMVRSDLPLHEHARIGDQLLQLEDVEAMTENMYGQAFFYFGNRSAFLYVKGIDPVREARVTQIKDYVQEGTFFIKSGEIILGSELAMRLGLGIGDTIVLGSPESKETFEYTIAGIFTSGHYEYDANLVLLTLADAQQLFNFDASMSEIGLRLDNPYRAPEVKKAISLLLGSRYEVVTWMDINKALLSALKLEKIVLGFVVGLVVLVASFNIASTLIVAVTKKTKDIGILRSIGATGMSIARIFAMGGLLLGGAGILLGASLGAFVCYVIRNIHRVIEIPQAIYYFDRIPVAFNTFDLVWIGGCAIAICFLASIYPAWRAAQLLPVDALRYE